MITSRKAETRLRTPRRKDWPSGPLARGPYALISRLFAGKAVSEAVATHAHYHASAEAIWNHVVFYEEIPGHAPLILRALLTHPIRTAGDKGRVGAMVRCQYGGGHLVKRITAVEPPHFLQFEVIEQRLGIESCILASGGSYQIASTRDATDVELVTKYRALLHPRVLWRPLETLLIHQLHNHILRSVSRALLAANPAPRLAPAESLTPECATRGGLACTLSPSSSRH